MLKVQKCPKILNLVVQQLEENKVDGSESFWDFLNIIPRYAKRCDYMYEHLLFSLICQNGQQVR